MRNPQRGIFLISAAIAVAIVGMLITFGMNQYVQSLRTHKAESVGEALKVLGEGVQSFIVEHHAEIREALGKPNAQTVKDTGDIAELVTLTRVVTASGRSLRISVGGEPARELTAADIVRLMKLAGVGDKPPMMPDAHYRISIFTDGNNKNAQDIRGLIYLDKPFTKTYGGDIDWTQLSTALRKMGVHGGFSRKDDESHFAFPLTPAGATVNQRQLPNPENTAGILAMRAGYLLGPLNAYLRRDGSEPMTGDLDMGEQNIVGVKQISGHADTLKIAGTADISGQLLVGPGASGRAAATAGQNKEGWVITGKGLASGNVLAGGDARMVRDVAKHDEGIVAGSKGVWSYGDVWAKRDIYNEDGNVYARGKTPKNGNVKADGSIEAGANVEAGRNISAKQSVSGGTITSQGTVTAAGSLISQGGALQLKNFRAEANTSCAGMEGGIAMNRDGRVVSCQSGRWQISLVTRIKTETRYVDRTVGWGYREWHISSMGPDIQDYRFGNAKVCRLSSNQKFNPATVKPGVSMRYLYYDANQYVLHVPQAARAALPNLTVACIYTETPSRAYANRRGSRAPIPLQPSVSGTFEGDTARNFVQQNPPSTEYRWFTYDRYKFLTGDAGHHYDLGDWDQCIIDSSYGNAWAGWDLRLYQPQTYYGNTGWLFRVKKTDGRALCWRNRS